MRFLLSILISLSPILTLAQARQTPKEYIEKYDQDAVSEMLNSGVPASITLAQGMLESSYGNSELAKKARNHFGIKCHSTWKGERFTMDDDAKNECFRVYPSVYDSYKDHSDFLKRNRRYAFLFDLKRTDYKGWAKGLKKAGYATNPKYPTLLINLIETNNLSKYDRMDKNDLKGLGKTTKGTNSSVGSDASGAISSGQGAGASSSDNNKSNKGIQISNNNIKFVIAQSGDTPKIIAKRYRVGPWQIKHYNGFKKGQKIKAGTVVYLQPKRSKYNGDSKIHTVKKGDSMWSISQKYGVKLRKLYRKNGLEKGSPIKVGQKLN